MDVTEQATETTTYYIAKRGDQFFGFETEYVRESSHFSEYTVIPETRPELVGVVNLRNSILPIILPDQWILTETCAFNPSLPVVVLKANNTSFALQFDEVIGVFNTSIQQELKHPYRHEVPYFKNLVTQKDGILFTTIDTTALIEAINSVTL